MEFFRLIAENWLSLLFSFLIVLVPIVLGRIAIAYLLDRVLLVIAARTKNQLDDMLLYKLRTPVYLLVILSAIDIAILRSRFLIGDWTDVFLRLTAGTYILIGFWILSRVTATFFKWYGEELAHQTQSEIDDHLIPFIDRVVNIIIISLGTITILSHFDVDVTGLVATLGIASLAIALAAQASLADVISGILIIADRPFRVGDQVMISDYSFPLVVLQVGMRSTRLRTFDNRVIVVPNSTMAQSNLINRTFPHSIYRLEAAIGVAYDSDVDEVKRVLFQALEPIEHIYKEKPNEVFFLNFGESSLDFVVRWWIEVTMDRDISLDMVNTAIFNALNEANIEMPFPQRDVYIRKNES